MHTPVPFICECADPTCSEIVPLELDQYEEIRLNPRHFLNIPGHQAAAQGVAVVVTERDGYVIVEKIGAMPAMSSRPSMREAPTRAASR